MNVENARICIQCDARISFFDGVRIGIMAMLSIGVLSMSTGCTRTTDVKEDFRFENYYSVWTGWKGGSEEAAERMIEKELQERLPKGTDARDLIDFIGSFDPTFEWKEEPYCDASGCRIAAGNNPRESGAQCWRMEPEDGYMCDHSYYSSRAPDLLFLAKYVVGTRVYILVDDSGRVDSVEVQVGKRWK